MRLSRRQFLAWSGSAGLSALAIRPGRGSAGVLDRLFHGEPPKPRTPITPNEEFYLTSYRSPPPIRLGEWRLVVDGLVDRSLTLDYQQLLAKPSVSAAVTLECIGNSVGGEYIGTAVWEGTPLRDLLEEAGVSPAAIDVVFHAADHYSDGIRVDRARAGDVLVAHHMNRAPLPLAHGFPARIIVPGLYGMKSVQWLTRIEVVDRDYRGYYQKKGWTDEAVVKTTSWIDVPLHGSTLRGERLQVQGTAFAGTRGVRRVEVSFDEGETWEATTLDPPLGPAAWVFWHYDWGRPKRGSHSLLVRAVDGDGGIQRADEQGPAPDGATGLHQITVTVER